MIAADSFASCIENQKKLPSEDWEREESPKLKRVQQARGGLPDTDE